MAKIQTTFMRSLHESHANRILPTFCLKPEYSFHVTVVIVCVSYNEDVANSLPYFTNVRPAVNSEQK